MDRALQSVIAEGASIRKAALEYNVPRSSLADRVSGRTIPGTTSGPPRYLNTSEEDELVQFLTRCAAIGYGKSRKEVIALSSLHANTGMFSSILFLKITLHMTIIYIMLIPDIGYQVHMN